MKTIIERLKSPVVIGQVITNIAGIVVLLLPDKADFINELVILIMGVINVFAGLNNPTDKSNF